MKKVIFLIFVINVFSLHSQCVNSNLINNGNFESCDVVGGCPSFSGGVYEGKFNEVSSWKPFGYYGYGLPAGCASHPDVWVDNNNHTAGLYGREGIYYDFGNILKKSMYKLKYDYQAGCPNPAGENQCETTSGSGINVWGTTTIPGPLTCNTISGVNLQRIDNSRISVPNYDCYTTFHAEKFVSITDNMRYLSITNDVKDNCNEYVIVDNVSLEDYCCADYILYQNVNPSNVLRPFDLPAITQRKEYIRAGYNVNAPNTIKGNVVVKADKHVLFQAGNFVSLEPGFSIEPGATFEAKIGCCGLVDGFPETNPYAINLIYYTNAVYFDCSGDWQHSAAFQATGATHYRVRIFDRWGEKVYDTYGFVHETYQTYWDGTGANMINPEELYTVQLELFNCNDDSKLTKGFSFVPFYINGCHPYNKTDEVFNTLDENSIIISEDMTIYPNPATDVINILTKEETDGLDVVLLNSMGQVAQEVHLIANNKVASNSFSMHTENLSRGVYCIKVRYKENTISKKIILN